MLCFVMSQSLCVTALAGLINSWTIPQPLDPHRRTTSSLSLLHLSQTEHKLLSAGQCPYPVGSWYPRVKQAEFEVTQFTTLSRTFLALLCAWLIAVAQEMFCTSVPFILSWAPSSQGEKGRSGSRKGQVIHGSLPSIPAGFTTQRCSRPPLWNVWDQSLPDAGMVCIWEYLHRFNQLNILSLKHSKIQFVA